MPKCGVYNEGELKLLEVFEKFAKQRAGWVRPMRIREATRDNIALWAQVFDYPNPLWRDPEYAKDSRWGGIIAPPFYQEGIMLVSWMPDPVPEAGFPAGGGMLGEDWDFHTPVRIGDSFKIWREKPFLRDISTEDSPLRRFICMQHDENMYNQHDELVTHTKCYMAVNYSPEMLPFRPEPEEAPVFTPEQLDYVQGVYEAEVLRGADTLFWEDVSVGDSLPESAMGPTTIWDMALIAVARQDQDLVPMNEQIKDRSKFIGMETRNPRTNVIENFMEGHLVANGGHQGAVERNSICRCITNWMGDDGFITRFNWRQTKGSCIGNSLVSHARVKGKRIENGRYLVDLDAWNEYIDGTICAFADVTVELCSLSKPGSGEAALPNCAFAPGDSVVIAPRRDIGWFAYAGASAVVKQRFSNMEYYDGMDNFLCLEITGAGDESLIGTTISLYADSVNSAAGI